MLKTNAIFPDISLNRFCDTVPFKNFFSFFKLFPLKQTENTETFKYHFITETQNSSCPSKIIFSPLPLHGCIPPPHFQLKVVSLAMGISVKAVV